MANNCERCKADQTLCWKCRNALGGCSWSDKFEAVKGWKAEATTISNGCGEVPSFIVRDCPQFCKDDGKTEHIDDEGAQNLMLALYKLTIRDYVTLLKRRETQACAGDIATASKTEVQIKHIERFLPRWLTEKIKREEHDG